MNEETVPVKQSEVFIQRPVDNQNPMESQISFDINDEEILETQNYTKKEKLKQETTEEKK
jgi:hypothetical protein